MTSPSPMENYNKVIAKAWTDKAFKDKLKSDPKAALKEMGFEIPEDVNISVVEDTSKAVTLVLPAPPKEGDLSVDDLASISGGTGITTTITITVICL